MALGAPPPMGGGRGPEKEVDIPKSLAYSTAVVVQTMGVSSATLFAGRYPRDDKS